MRAKERIHPAHESRSKIVIVGIDDDDGDEVLNRQCRGVSLRRSISDCNRDGVLSSERLNPLRLQVCRAASREALRLAETLASRYNAVTAEMFFALNVNKTQRRGRKRERNLIGSISRVCTSGSLRCTDCFFLRKQHSM